MLNQRLGLLARSAKTSLDHIYGLNRFSSLGLSPRNPPNSSQSLFTVSNKSSSGSPLFLEKPNFGFQIESSTSHIGSLLINKCPGASLLKAGNLRSSLLNRCMTTLEHPEQTISEDGSSSLSDVPPRIKFKRPDKTARHIMQILDREAVEEVRAQREVPDIQPGYTVQLKVEVPENKRRLSTLKGIVIARRNAGLHTTFRIRRMVAGVGVESVFPLYSPNIKEMKVLEKKKVRRAKLYYLRDKMNALKK